MQTGFQPPQFEFVTAAKGLLTPAEMDGLIARHTSELTDGWLEQG